MGAHQREQVADGGLHLTYAAAWDGRRATAIATPSAAAIRTTTPAASSSRARISRCPAARGARHRARGDEAAAQVAAPAARAREDPPRRLRQRLERRREDADLVHELEAVAALDAHERRGFGARSAAP